MAIESSHSSAQLLAQKIKKHFEQKPSLFLLLDGEMGSGKTTFTRYLAEELGFPGITSPTFVGLHEYSSGEIDLFHLDLYQVTMAYEDLRELLLREPEKKKLFIVEWSEKLSESSLEKLENATDLWSLSFFVENSSHQISLDPEL